MSIIDNILQRFGFIKAANEKYPPWVLEHARANRWNLPDPSLYANQAELFARLSWIYTACSIPSQIAAIAGIDVVRVRGEKERDVPNHPFELLLDRPNPSQSRYEFLRSTVIFWLLNANAYWWLNVADENSPPSEIWIIPPGNITPVPDGQMYIAGYDYDPGDGNLIRLPTWQIVHFKDFHPSSQFLGLSRVEPVSVDAAADIATAKYNAKLYGENNGRLPGIIAFADMIIGPTWDQIKDDIATASKTRNYMTLRGSGKGGIEWMRASDSLKDMEYINGRNFTKSEIYDVFAPGLNVLLSSTGDSAKTGKSTLIDLCVYPLLIALCQKITSNILPLYDSTQITYRVRPEDIRIADRAMELAEILEYSKYHLVDEVREKFYQSDPIAQASGEEDDERGKLLVSQITPDTGKPEPEQSPLPVAPVMPPEQRGDYVGDTYNDEPEEDFEDAAMMADLDRWKRKAKNALDKGRSPAVKFDSDTIPPEMFERIETGLKACRTSTDISALFIDAKQAPAYKFATPNDVIKILELSIEMMKNGQ